MLTVSDNDATNELVKRLGSGDAAEGMRRVNAFCTEHGLTDSNMGRLMLDFSSTEDNYTSVRDSAAFLRSLYYGRLCGSEKMLSYLKQQQRTGKLPAGIPTGVETANKTGELDDVENDVALVFVEGNPYVISVMTGELTDTAATRAWIVELSEAVYEYVVGGETDVPDNE
jgi:beta-lactamase class A